MSEVNLNKILEKRTKLLLDFFFRVRYWGFLVFLVIFLVSVILSAILLFNDTAHIIAGCISAICFLLFLLALLGVFDKTIKREEVEAVMAYDREIVYNELFRNLSIEKIRSKYISDPIEVVCPEVYPKMNSIIYRYFRYDNKIYYSQVGYSWLFFGEKSLYYYHASVNHIYGYTGYEVSYEFDYKDIISIKTSVNHEDDVETFTLTLSLANGETLDIALRTRPNKFYESTHKLSEKEAKILSTIRNVIRNSK